MYKLLFFLLIFCAFSAAGAPAPDFTITDSDGKQHKLYADYINQGKAVLIEIFFTTCPPCNAIAADFQTLYQNITKQYSGKIEFFMLSNLSTDANTKVAQYKTTKNITMPAAGADGGSLAAVQPYESGQFGTFYGTPTFVLISPGTGDANYDIRGANGFATLNLVSAAITKLLGPASSALTCQIKTPKGEGLENASITFTGRGAPVTVKTDNNGMYTTPNLVVDTPLIGKPDKNDDVSNGVSTFDLSLIAQHILGVDTFKSNYSRLSADVNNSGTLTAFDIVTIRKLLLGVIDSFPSVHSWSFLPAQTMFTAGATCPIIIAYKMGDVNESALANSNFTGTDVEDRHGGVLPLYFDDRYLHAGESYTIALYSPETLRLTGLQLAFAAGPQNLFLEDLRTALPDFDAESFNLQSQQRGWMPLSWNSGLHPAQIETDAPLLQLQIRARRDGLLSDLLQLSAATLTAEAYTDDKSIRPLELKSRPLAAGNAEPLKINPNPAKGYFTLSFENSGLTPVLLQLTDVRGALVFEEKQALAPGMQVLRVRPEKLAQGLYFVKVNGIQAGKLEWLGE